MKRIVCILLCLLTLVGCTKPVEVLKIEGIQEINYTELTQNLNSNVKFLLYIGRPDCGDCQSFYPLLENYINSHQNTGIYYLNIKAFRDAAKAKNASQQEKDFYENLYKELNFDWTPTIQVISNGRMIKDYQYLDEEYYQIQDRNKQKEKRQDYINQFQTFMNDYFKEVNS